MGYLFISLNNNVLKLSNRSKAGVFTHSVEVPEGMVDVSRITDVEAFSNFLKETLASFSELKLTKNKVVFLVEPQDLLLRFVTIDRSVEDVDSEMVDQIKKKTGQEDLENFYYSYQKIAPFVFQVMVIKKETLETYLEVSRLAELSLSAVMPWVLMLPKFLPTNDPSVIILRSNGKYVVSLSELNGIYFSEVYNTMRSQDELLALVEQLSVYKRAEPISKVYVLSDGGKDLDIKDSVHPLEEFTEENEELKGFEVHMMFDRMLSTSDHYLRTQVNLLTALPVPVVEEKNNAVILVGAFAAIVLVVVGGGIFMLRGGDSNSSDDLANVPEDSAVLSETSTDTVAEAEIPEEVVEETVEVDKTEHAIRVENGAGIAGVAGAAQTFLEGLEYNVASIGNSDTQDYDKTVLRFKASSDVIKEMLVKDMESEYAVEVGDPLDDGAEYDVLVTIGTE
jgi:hypothetical protein